MAYDGSVRINTKVDNTGIKKGMVDSVKAVENLEKALDNANTAVKSQEKHIETLHKNLHDAAKEAERLRKSGDVKGFEKAEKKADSIGQAIEVANTKLETLKNRAAEIPAEIEQVKNAGVFGFKEQAEQTAEKVRVFQQEIQRLNDLLAKEQDPATIKTLQYEIAATEKAYNDFKGGISEPVKDIMLTEVQTKLETVNADIQAIQQHLETETDPLIIMKLIAALQNARDRSEDLQSQLTTLQDVKVDEIANDVEELDRNLEDTNESAQRVQSAFSAIASAAKTVAGVSVNAFHRVGKTLATLARNGLKAAQSILKIGSNSGKASKNVNFLGRRIMRLAAAVFVFNAIRRAMRDFQQTLGNTLMANADFARSWSAIKDNMLTAFAPLWEVIQPAIVSFMALLARFTAALAQFMSILFGKTIQQSRESAKALQNQANALNKVGGAAKDAGKQIASFDEINQAAADTAGGGGGAVDGIGVDPAEITGLESYFESFKSSLDSIFDVFKKSWAEFGQPLVDAFKRAVSAIKNLLVSVWQTFVDAWEQHGKPVVDAFLRLITTVLNIIADIAEAFIRAWDSKGAALIESILKMFAAILNLLGSIGEAFSAAWNSGVGEQILENILQIITNISDIITLLADRIREAWEENGNGEAIWQSMLEIIERVTAFIERITSATKEWLENINFEPILAGFRSLISALENLIDIILDGLAWAYENVLLPFKKWLIEIAVPAALTVITNTFDLLSAALEYLEPYAMKIWEDFLKPIAAWTGGVIVSVLKGLAGIIKTLADHMNIVLAVLIPLTAAFLAYKAALLISSLIQGVTMAMQGLSIAQGIATIAQYAWNLAMSLNPILLVIGLIGGLVAAFIWLWNTSDGFRDGLIAAWDAIVNAIKSAINFIIGFAEGFANSFIRAINMIINALNSISFDIPDWVPIIGGKKFGFNLSTIQEISIPRLARGGIVDEATIAMIGEKGREAVVPLENNAEWMNPILERLDRLEAIENALEKLVDSSGQTVIEVDRRVFGRVVREAYDDNKRTSGARIQPRGSLT